MDCRKGLLFFAGFLVPLSGCTLRPASEIRKEGAEPAGDGVIKKPETFVAFSDYRAAAAFAAETSPENQAVFREEARTGYLKAIEIEPKHVPAYLALARLQQASNELAPALETYKRALAVTTKDATIWYEMGMCQARQKQFGDAVASLQKACELRPDDKKCRETMGYTLARAGRWAESLTVLSGVVGEARAHFCLARMLKHMNQPEEAKQYLAAALSRDPELPGARELFVSLVGPPPSDVAPSPAGPTALAPVPTIRFAPERTPNPPDEAVLAPRVIRLPPRPVLSVSAGTY
jgi:tetratricopeptide (TPR) repeat protein